MAVRALRRRRDVVPRARRRRPRRSSRSIATDGARVMKTIEGFSVECSINKVWTSEALAWAVDEARAGVRRQRLLARVSRRAEYRDARITRIYEGTNEINRMLIPTRLLKQSPEVFSAEAVRRALAEPAATPATFAAEREYVGASQAARRSGCSARHRAATATS